MRVDKWLWCMRLFKTRTMATDGCKGGKVKMNGTNLKPSRELKVGDTVVVSKGMINRTVKVLAFPKSRLGAKLVHEYMEELTPQAEFDKIEMARMSTTVKYDKGRPTKKDRREMDEFLAGWEDWELDDE